jgi:bacteriocin resistance YdeI/OmpD-like protein/uncharacterized protein DUF1905
MEFRAELQRTGGTTTGFEVPQEIVDGLGGGGRPKVLATVNGHQWRSSIARMGGGYWLGVSAANRAAAGVEGGQTLDVTVVLDTAERTVTVPADLAAALEAAPAAKAAFDRLSYSHRREHVRAIEDAKTPETRARRITRAVEKLSAPIPGVRNG